MYFIDSCSGHMGVMSLLFGGSIVGAATTKSGKQDGEQRIIICSRKSSDIRFHGTATQNVKVFLVDYYMYVGKLHLKSSIESTG